MAERPLLVLPSAQEVDPPRLGGGADRPIIPDRERQRARIGPRFGQLRAALGNDRGPMQLRDDPMALAPDRVLVFEIAGSVADFARAAARVPGLELMGEYEGESPPDQDFATRDTRTGREGQRREDRLVDERFYLAMPDVAALRQLLALFDRWAETGQLEEGFAPFKHLFAQLRTLRPWGPADRIPRETIEYWTRETHRDPTRSVRTELELWFHQSVERRHAVAAEMRESVRQIQGVVVHESELADIAYHGMLVDIPAAEVVRLSARENVSLAISDAVMFLRPQTVLASPVFEEEGEPLGRGAPAPEALGDPIAALLDGVPVQRHALLDGRIDVDDADDLEGRAVVERRHHGTAMASLILHGDLNRNEGPLPRRLYLRPVMIAPEDGEEHTPTDRLFIDTLYKAILRIKGTGEQAGVAPQVFIVNLSLGDRLRPFANVVSPLARLVDVLATKYNILFLISAGNIVDSIELPTYDRWSDFENADPLERQSTIIRALFETKLERSLLSPAESINALTVGAQHTDALTNRMVGLNAVDPFVDEMLPNPSSAIGLGYRRAVKPDLLLPGGREFVRMGAQGGGVRLIFGRPQRMFGLKAAAPDPARRGRLDQTALRDGTSSAAALGTRAAHQVFDALMDAPGGSSFADLDSQFFAVMTKALLLHTARWPDSAEAVRNICGPADRRLHAERGANATRFFGFGVPNIPSILDCAPNQATMAGYGDLRPDHAHYYRIPLPESLERVTDPREVTVTIAWLSPVKPGHQSYRAVKLEAAPNDPKATFGVSRHGDQPSDAVVRKGTVFHERFSGDRAVPFVDDGHLSLRVWCKDDAGIGGTPIRYAVVVTIESADGIPVYEQVRNRLQIRARAL